MWVAVTKEIPSTSAEVYGVRLSKKISESPLKYYGILFFGSPSRMLLDRSPSGTGSSAHIAYLHHIGEVEAGDVVEFVSAINTSFSARILGVTESGGRRAVIPEISTVDRGCHITGYSVAIREPDDPARGWSTASASLTTKLRLNRN